MLYIMLLYCFKQRKNTKSKNPNVVRKAMLLSKCAVCDNKNSKFFKDRKTSELLISLGINTPISKTSFIRPPFVLEILTS